MNTQHLTSSPDDLQYAAKLLQSGQIVGMPTETVYGLAADALNPDAVKKVFEAKGRPADNPLIVHIAALEQLSQAAKEIPPLAYALAEAFWPGPLTMIFPKQAQIPMITSGGLDTVGVRMPAHPIAQELIRLASTPIPRHRKPLRLPQPNHRRTYAAGYGWPHCRCWRRRSLFRRGRVHCHCI
ncbi:MAG: L-threonylcarbamoyladenylate synthase [Ruminococcus sp.]